MQSDVSISPIKSKAQSSTVSSSADSHVFQSECPADKKFKIEDLMAFRRGRGDLIFSVFCVIFALFIFAMFWTQTGWQKRKLPDELGTYLLRQFGIIEGEGRLARLGRILKQSWVIPLVCVLILVPAAFFNIRNSIKSLRWRKRFLQPVSVNYELMQWLKAGEFVLWFIAYTIIVPLLGYLLSTLILGTALPWRMGYRTKRWFMISATTSLCIVLVFRTGLQIKTPVNIWLYEFLPTAAEGFMKTWF